MFVPGRCMAPLRLHVGGTSWTAWIGLCGSLAGHKVCDILQGPVLGGCRRPHVRWRPAVSRTSAEVATSMFTFAVFLAVMRLQVA